MYQRILLIVAMGLGFSGYIPAAEPDAGASSAVLRLATFDIDATPPAGSLMAYDPATNKWDLALRAQPVTHIGLGEARVEKVASNRRIAGPDGRVRGVRYTACSDAALRAEPEGTIDPVVSLMSFWNGANPVAVLSYYATHPQSYY